MVPHGTKLFHCIYLLNAEITPGYLNVLCIKICFYDSSRH